MFRNTAKLLTLAAGLTFSGQAFAQASDSEPTDVSISIAQALAITETASLRFGSVVKGDTETTTVTINETSGDRDSSGGNATLITSTSGRATYTVTGEAGAGFDIALDDDSFDLDGPGAAVLPVTLVPSAASGTLTGGTATIGVGGSVDIDNEDATIVAGAYTGVFTVTVTYN